MTANSFASAAAMGLLHIAWTNVNHILLTMLTIPYIPPLLLWLNNKTSAGLGEYSNL